MLSNFNVGNGPELRSQFFNGTPILRDTFLTPFADIEVATAVPVPASLWLFASAVAGLLGFRFKR